MLSVASALSWPFEPKVTDSPLFMSHAWWEPLAMPASRNVIWMPPHQPGLSA